MGVKTTIKLLITCYFLLICQAVYSVEIEGLYSATVRVESQNVRERRSASTDALAEVFIRASGTASVLLNDEIQISLTRADQYMLSYIYQSFDEVKEDLLKDEASQTTGFLLKIDFDPFLVNKTLRSAQLPIWGSNRPQLLVWWAVEDEADRRLITLDKDPESHRLVESHGRRRGIPLSWPLLDLSETSLITPEDIWGLYSEKVIPVSKKYGAQAILLGRARKTSTMGWFGNWVLLLNGVEFRSDGEADDLNNLMQKAMDFSADILAEQYAILKNTDNSGETILRVSGVNSLADYAELNEYLNSMSSIGQFVLKLVEKEIITYALLLDSDVSSFEKVIKFDNRLKKIVNENEMLIDESILEYQWTGQ